MADTGQLFGVQWNQTQDNYNTFDEDLIHVTITITHKDSPYIRWEMSAEDAYDNPLNIINTTLSINSTEVYNVDNPEGEQEYELSLTELNEGDNEIIITATAEYDTTEEKELNAHKEGIETPEAGDRVIVHNVMYTISTVTIEAETAILTLEQALEEDVEENQLVEVLNELILPHVTTDTEYVEMELIRTRYVDNKAIDEFVVNIEGNEATFKVEMERKDDTEIFLEKPRAIFRFKEDE